MARSKHFYIRRVHRYLGIVLGVQFLFWTISGMYFSWSNMDEIHGDFEKKSQALIPATSRMIAPSTVFEHIIAEGADSIVSLQLVNINGDPVYQVRYIDNEAAHHDRSGRVTVLLADAVTGSIKPPLSKEQSIALAISRFNGKEPVKDVAYLEHTGGHHEYRASPLPAYSVTFDNAAKTTVYVASELGTVQSFRNEKWRIFDFLWMTHTMDYQSRDNISNYLLRIFSVFGAITVISGFVLYFVSSRRFRRRRHLKQAIV
jgi:uncharacterized iron-regulated membrane protein